MLSRPFPIRAFRITPPRITGLVAAATLLASALTGAGAAGAETKRTKFDWDALGAEFCRLTLAGDYAGMQDILTPSLIAQIAAASANPEMPGPRTLFQSYTNEVPVCEAKTRNAAIVAVTRSNAGGAAPTWTEYVEVVPEADGTTRIDNILFATKRSDTLRSRLDYYIANR